MKLIFTICSNNYLAQAKVLVDSINQTNPDYKSYIFLVDELNSTIDYSLFKATVVSIKELGLESYNIFERYNIIELNTCIKASCFKYLLSKYKEAKHIHYFDPDIQLFAPLEEVDGNFNCYSILLTPHILTPNDGFEKLPSENLFLMYGIFNLGYLGLKAGDKDVLAFLDWWEYRTLNFGYHKLSEGFFVDQLWINFVPLFYRNKTLILDSPGYNMAPWNLHERILKITSAGILVNENYKLIFYHFSSYSFKDPIRLAKNNKYTFEGRKDLKQLYSDYHKLLLKNKVDFFCEKTCVFFKNEVDEIEKKQIEIKKEPTVSVFYTRLKILVKLFLPPILLLPIKWTKKNILNK